MSTSVTTPTAAALFGPNWRHINRGELEQHFWQNRRRHNYAPITRTLNALIKHGYGGQCRIRYAYGHNPDRRPSEHNQQITLGELADLAADAQTNQIKIVQYGPERQRIAAHFFSESDSRFQAVNERGLPAGLSVGYYTPSPEFLQIPEHIAIMSDRQELVALLGPAHDPASLAAARLLAAAPQLLTAARLAHYWLTERAGEATSTAAIETLRAVVAQASGEPRFGQNDK